MTHDDQKYIDALVTGEENLIREIYERFSSKILKMVIQYGGSEADAADIFQDALLSIYNRTKNGSFILTCPFEGFLYLICKRKWVKSLQKTNRLTVTFEPDPAYSVDESYSMLADECLMYDARKALITQSVTKLSEKCRQLLHLSWEGNTMEEVAELLKVSYGYARKKKSECMATLIRFIHQSPEYGSLKSGL